MNEVLLDAKGPPRPDLRTRLDSGTPAVALPPRLTRLVIDMRRVNGRLQALEQTVDFEPSLLVEDEGVGWAHPRTSKDALTNEQILLDRDEQRVEIRLQSDQGDQRIANRVRVVHFACHQCTPKRYHGPREIGARHRTDDAPSETVYQRDAARSLKTRALPPVALRIAWVAAARWG